MTTRRNSRRCAAVALFAFISGGVLAPSLLVGCEEKKPKVVETPPPPPPPAPQAPDPVQLDPIIASVKPDARVQFPQAHAPTDAALAQAVLQFADALAKGDDARFGAMLDPMSSGILAQITGSGGWEEAVKKIEAVRVVLCEGGDPMAVAQESATVVLAIQEPGAAYVLKWVAVKPGDKWAFAAAPSLAATKARASEWDGLPASSYAPSAFAFTPASSSPSGSNAPAIPEPEKPAPETKEDTGERTKQTPHGPVTIPGPGGRSR